MNLAFSFLFFFYISLIAGAYGDGAADSCYKGCRFHICSERMWHAMPGQDIAFTGALCDRRSANISHANSGEARIYHAASDDDDNDNDDDEYNERKFTRISEWRPSELTQAYTPHFFKLLTKKVFMYEDVGGKFVQKTVQLPHVGVAREYFQGNQADFFKDRCVVLPLTSWQEVDSEGHVVRNAVTKESKALEDCVAFAT